jgi:hypothetical protein
MVRRIVTEAEIQRALTTPPASSPRAQVRGLAVQKFAPQIKRISWNSLTVESADGQQTKLSLEPFVEKNTADWDGIESLEQFVRMVRG